MTQSSKIASNFFLFLCVLFLVAFPKGGIKANEIPLTFGYVLLGFYAVFFSITNLANSSFRRTERSVVYTYFATAPLSVISLALMTGNGVESVGYSIAFHTGFTILPLLFLIPLAPQIAAISRVKLLLYLRLCVNFAAVFGLIAFVYKLKTGEFIQIPFLTLNADDVDQLDGKYIDRGDGIFKLISTYNNGNIYGVSILMLLPLYDHAQSSKVFKLIVRISLLLTLSRTVWLGMFAYELLRIFYLNPLRKSALLQLIGAFAVAMTGVAWALSFLGLDIGFIFDSNLGGRADVVNSTKWVFLQFKPVGFHSEIIIVNIVSSLGTFPLILYFLSTLTPIAVGIFSKRNRDRFIRSCVGGMVMLQACGLSDGPILLIPVMAFYWALAALTVISNRSAEPERLIRNTASDI